MEAVYNIMQDILGKHTRTFFPIIATCALFIFISNAVGLIPGVYSPTTNLNVTLGCALVIFFSTHIYGVKEHGLAYFKHFLGPILPLAPLMLPIEIISHLARPMSLSVRLFGNMFADHMVLFNFCILCPLIVPIPVMLLGLLVVIVQTLVFCLLALVYFSMAVAHEEH